MKKLFALLLSLALALGCRVKLVRAGAEEAAPAEPEKPAADTSPLPTPRRTWGTQAASSISPIRKEPTGTTRSSAPTGRFTTCSAGAAFPP